MQSRTTVTQPTRPASQSDEVTFAHMPLSSLFQQLHSSEAGLSSQQVEQRLSEVGLNEPISIQRTAAIKQFLLLFANPLVAILLIASVISFIFGDATNAAIIVTIVLLSIIMNFVQTYQSQRVVEKLRAGVAPTASALRDEQWKTLLRRELVPGDIIQLAAGDLVPADARLLHTTDLHVQQAALTGESIPVEKIASEAPGTVENYAEIPNMVFLGTSIVSGTASAVVTATGRNTAFGDIMLRLAKRPPENEFEHGLRRFSFLIMQTVFFLILFVFLMGVLFKHQLFESVLFAIALAVGLTPEFLPMITTVTLGQGAARMAKQKVIVKHLESMQNFGSIDVFCSDKTGTLT
ncbi:MAG TPA: HAD-IC family P-type ATPase, partial [Ktedonobacteraceae bacterium]